MFSDSIGQGYFASNLTTTGWFARLVAALKTAYGDGGSGWHSTSNCPGASFAGSQTIFTASASWTPFSLGPNDLCVGGPAVNATMTEALVNGNIVDVLYHNGAAYGPFTVQIDAGAPVTVIPAGPLAIGKYTVTGPIAGTHTVIIKQTSAAGGVIVDVIGRNVTGIIAYGTANSYWSDSGTDGLPGSDPIHPSDIGHNAISSLLVPLLTPA